MQGWHDTTQLILQILSNPAWSGVGGVCAFLSITLSILHSRRSPTQKHNTSRRILKKIVMSDTSQSIAVGVSNYSLFSYFLKKLRTFEPI